MRRILLIGNRGQLGREIARELGERVTAMDYPEIDLADESGLRRIVRGEAGKVGQPYDLIINAAAYTAVDRAESEPKLAMAVNGRAPGILAEEAQEMGAALIHFSTDYVFDGKKSAPYGETDSPCPSGTYGASKLEGERAVKLAGGANIVLRTAWLYSLRSDSFVTKVIRWAREQDRLRIVSDQFSSPTWARSLARATHRIIKMAEVAGTNEGRYERMAAVRCIESYAGLYHLAGDGYASRLEWAREILAVMRERGFAHELRAKEIVPAVSADFSTTAIRPLFSALDCSEFEKAFGFKLNPWRQDLRSAFIEEM